MRLIGIDGGLGISTVAEYLKNLGAVVVSVSKIAQDVAKDKEVLIKLQSIFGKDIVWENGILNKELLAKIISTDNDKFIKLKEVIHPKINEKIQEEINKTANKNKIVVLDRRKIIESNAMEIFKMDEIWLIYTNIETQIKHLMNKFSIDEKSATELIESAMSFEEKREIANIVIDNTGTLEDLKKKIKKEYIKLKRRN